MKKKRRRRREFCRAGEGSKGIHKKKPAKRKAPFLRRDWFSSRIFPISCKGEMPAGSAGRPALQIADEFHPPKASNPEDVPHGHFRSIARQQFFITVAPTAHRENGTYFRRKSWKAGRGQQEFRRTARPTATDPITPGDNNSVKSERIS